MENVRRDYFEKELSLEERMAEAAFPDRLMAEARVLREQRYRSVLDYDPVLRWHCRLVE